jgi:hypothetical protein
VQWSTTPRALWGPHGYIEVCVVGHISALNPLGCSGSIPPETSTKLIWWGSK